MMPVGAYIHAKPDGTPFYVGKGVLQRAMKVGRKNNWYKNVVSKYGKENILKTFVECSNESIAFELEVGLIKTLKRNGYTLTNMTNGGEGISGFKMPEYEIERRKNSPSPTLGKKFTEEHRAKLSAAKVGKKTWNTGKKLTEEHRLKLVEAAKNRKVTRSRNEKGQYQ